VKASFSTIIPEKDSRNKEDKPDILCKEPDNTENYEHYTKGLLWCSLRIVQLLIRCPNCLIQCRWALRQPKSIEQPKILDYLSHLLIESTFLYPRKSEAP